jgi:hypothetical protein
MRTSSLVRGAVIAASVSLLVGIGPEARAQGFNVSGVWQGVNYTSQLPGPHKVTLSLNQSGSSVSGSFWVATGVYGTGQGQITGPNTMTIYWTNATPSCPGNYQNSYIVSGNSMTWTFTGQDCLGPEQGKGNAKRTMALGKKTISKQ